MRIPPDKPTALALFILCSILPASGQTIEGPAVMDLSSAAANAIQGRGPIASPDSKIAILDFFNLTKNNDYDQWESLAGRTLRRSLFSSKKGTAVSFPRINTALEELRVDTYYILPEQVPAIAERVEADLVVLGSFIVTEGVLATSLKVVQGKTGKVLSEETLFGQESEVHSFLGELGDALLVTLWGGDAVPAAPAAVSPPPPALASVPTGTPIPIPTNAPPPIVTSVDTTSSIPEVVEAIPAPFSGGTVPIAPPSLPSADSVTSMEPPETVAAQPAPIAGGTVPLAPPSLPSADTVTSTEPPRKVEVEVPVAPPSPADSTAHVEQAPSVTVEAPSVKQEDLWTAPPSVPIVESAKPATSLPLELSVAMPSPADPTVHVEQAPAVSVEAPAVKQADPWIAPPSAPIAQLVEPASSVPYEAPSKLPDPWMAPPSAPTFIDEPEMVEVYEPPAAPQAPSAAISVSKPAFEIPVLQISEPAPQFVSTRDRLPLADILNRAWRTSKTSEGVSRGRGEVGSTSVGSPSLVSAPLVSSPRSASLLPPRDPWSSQPDQSGWSSTPQRSFGDTFVQSSPIEDQIPLLPSSAFVPPSQVASPFQPMASLPPRPQPPMVFSTPQSYQPQSQQGYAPQPAAAQQMAQRPRPRNPIGRIGSWLGRSLNPNTGTTSPSNLGALPPDAARTRQQRFAGQQAPPQPQAQPERQEGSRVGRFFNRVFGTGK